jgi:hypothetical protein
MTDQSTPMINLDHWFDQEPKPQSFFRSRSASVVVALGIGLGLAAITAYAVLPSTPHPDLIIAPPKIVVMSETKSAVAQPQEREALEILAKPLPAPLTAASSRVREVRSTGTAVIIKKSASLTSRGGQAAGKPIEPYRNGMMATRLTGEALRLALIEDARITRELNKDMLASVDKTPS